MPGRGSSGLRRQRGVAHVRTASKDDDNVKSSRQCQSQSFSVDAANFSNLCTGDRGTSWQSDDQLPATWRRRRSAMATRSGEHANWTRQFLPITPDYLTTARLHTTHSWTINYNYVCLFSFVYYVALFLGGHIAHCTPSVCLSVRLFASDSFPTIRHCAPYKSVYYYYYYPSVPNSRTKRSRKSKINMQAILSWRIGPQSFFFVKFYMNERMRVNFYRASAHWCAILI